MMSGKIDIATLSKLFGHKSLKQTMKYAHLAPAHLQKAVFVMDDVYRVSTDTKLAQSNEKGLTDESQPFENLVELRGKSHALCFTSGPVLIPTLFQPTFSD